MPTELSASVRNFDWTTVIEGFPKNLYKYSAIQEFHLGKIVITPDGRRFRYSRVKGTLRPSYGAYNGMPANKHITYAALPSAIAADDRFCTVTYPSSCGYASAGFLANELAGGYIVVSNNNDDYPETHMITRNSAISATTSTCKIYIECPFGTAHTTSDGAEAWPNPYAYILSAETAATDYACWMGVPHVKATTTNPYCFLQTRGPCWVTPGGGDASPGDTASDRTMYFVGDGSVNGGSALTIESGYQKAGHIMDTTASGTSAGPLLFLEIE
jgi:hypothetical protein